MKKTMKRGAKHTVKMTRGAGAAKQWVKFLVTEFAPAQVTNSEGAAFELAAGDVLSRMDALLADGWKRAA